MVSKRFPTALLQEICQYVGPDHFLRIALIGRSDLRRKYQCLFGTRTNVRKVFLSVSLAQWVFRELQGTTLIGELLRGDACSFAAFHGNLNLLKWLRRTTGPQGHGPCQSFLSGCYSFSKSSGSHCYQYVPETGCAWDKWTCARAAENGHLTVLKWARENGCPWNEWTCAFAAENGHLTVLKWARENRCPWDRHTCSYAAKNGHLTVLK